MNVVRGIYNRELGVRDDLVFANLLYERHNVTLMEE